MEMFLLIEGQNNTELEPRVLALIYRISWQRPIHCNNRVDETLDISGAVVVPESNPEAGYTG